MLAGPMDYTPGAMYTFFEASLQMLADNPTAYYKEQECTDFISKIPTVFDETVALAGEVGEYVVMARAKDSVWYVGAMTNWQGRDMEIDFSFLPEGNYEAEIFQDGVNANKQATDYRKRTVKIASSVKMPVKLSNGGCWAVRIYRTE